MNNNINNFYDKINKILNLILQFYQINQLFKFLKKENL